MRFLLVCFKTQIKLWELPGKVLSSVGQICGGDSLVATKFQGIFGNGQQYDFQTLFQNRGTKEIPSQSSRQKYRCFDLTRLAGKANATWLGLSLGLLCRTLQKPTVVLPPSNFYPFPQSDYSLPPCFGLVSAVISI